MKLDKNKQKLILLSFIALLVLYVIVSFLFLPSVKQVRELSTQIKEKNLDINKKKEETESFAKLSEETDKLKDELKEAKSKFLWDSDSSHFLDEFTKLAHDLQMEFVLLKPEKSVKVVNKQLAKDAKQPSKDKKKDAQKEKDKQGTLSSNLVQQPIKVTVKSDYSDLVKFVKRIEELDKFIRIDSLSIDSGQEDINKQNINLSLTIFNQGSG